MSSDPRNIRPDPDALLAEVKAQDARQRRGKLKVFFGMSPGVGKTYAMLEEARKRAEEGADIVVGYAEPHGRPDTEAVLMGLDILPYKVVEHRGATLKEFDLDAALARAPGTCCVDELAHSNGPGLRHPKRWQDVEELLAAGINVYTTLNVQHLESVNDLIERIAGVRVRETLPDAIFDAADEVELVDIAPEELLERFRAGRVYKPEQAERASRNFFTKGNLIALRELALRKTADRVDDQMQEHRLDERLRRLVPASERVLVCVGPSPLSARVIRSARRLSTGLRAKLTAVSVLPEGTSAPPSQVEANLRLAEELGAQVVTLTGRNVAGEVLHYALAHNVTKIVIGKPATSRLRDVLFGSLVDELIRRSGEIDIYVIRGDGEPGGRQTLLPGSRRPPGHDWWGYAFAAAAVAAATAIGWPLCHRLGLANENLLMLYLLVVLWVATQRSRRSAILASALAVISFDLFFVEPIGRLTVNDRQYVVTFLVMLLTALVISTLTHRVRAQATGAREREKRTAALLGFSRDLGMARNIEQIAAATQQHVADVVGCPALLLSLTPEKRLVTVQEIPGRPLSEKEIAVAQWAAEHDQPSGRGTSTLPSAVGTYVPLRGATTVMGVLAVLGGPDEVLAGERRALIEAFAAQAALAVERARLADDARTAWERVEAEFLRNTLLSGVSHELRTPLAGIAGAASALLETGHRLAEAERTSLLATVVAEAQRMDRLIGNLLDMTRMESGGVALKREWVPPDELIGAALHHMERRLAGREVRTNVAPGLALIHVDETAIQQVLTNLLDNAAEHTPPGTPIEISVRGGLGEIVFAVADEGPGIPPGTEKRVFEKFFRAHGGDNQRRRGIGLGLALCRGIVEAHGGTISASNAAATGNRPAGARFTVSLPQTAPPPSVDGTA